MVRQPYSRWPPLGSIKKGFLHVQADVQGTKKRLPQTKVITLNFCCTSFKIRFFHTLNILHSGFYFSTLTNVSVILKQLKHFQVVL